MTAFAHCCFRRQHRPPSGRTRLRRPHSYSIGVHVDLVHMNVLLRCYLACHLTTISSRFSAVFATLTQPPPRRTSSPLAPCAASFWVTRSNKKATSAITPALSVSLSHATSTSTKRVFLLRRLIRGRSTHHARRLGLTRSSSPPGLASLDVVRRSSPPAGVHQCLPLLLARCPRHPTLQCHLRPRLRQHLFRLLPRRRHQLPSRRRTWRQVRRRHQHLPRRRARHLRPSLRHLGIRWPHGHNTGFTSLIPSMLMWPLRPHPRHRRQQFVPPSVTPPRWRRCKKNLTP